MWNAAKERSDFSEKFRSNSDGRHGAAQSEQRPTRADTSAGSRGCGALRACKFCTPTPERARDAPAEEGRQKNRGLGEEKEE